MNRNVSGANKVTIVFETHGLGTIQQSNEWSNELLEKIAETLELPEDPHEGRPQMDAPKYRIGQSVIYKSPGAHAPQGDYVIIARLPQRNDGDFEYRIKHSHELHQRNAKESELKPTARSN